jgi:hypothetical protein
VSIPALTLSEKKSDYPILIVDKIGEIGEKLIADLKQESLVIFVSSKKIEEEKVVHVPYVKKIPTIPDNTYSHIFVIDEYGKISKEFISSFVKKAKHDGSKLILAININFTNEKFIQKYINSYDGARIIVFGDIFAKDYLFDSSTYINKFIKQVQNYQQINIPGDGTTQTNPVFLDDVTVGILQVGFIEDEAFNTFFLYPKNKPTLLTLAHIFQKRQPTIKIDFIKSSKQKKEKLELRTEGKYLLEENYDLENRIKKIDFEKKDTVEVKREEYYKKDNALQNFKFGYLFAGVILIFGFFFLLPLFSTLFLSATGGLFLNNLKTNVENHQLFAAKNDAFIAYFMLKTARETSTLLAKEARFIGKEKELSDFTAKIDQGVELAYTASAVLDSIDKIKSLSYGSAKNNSIEFSKVSDNFKNALVVYLKQKEAGNIPAKVDKKLQDVISFMSTTIDLWPDILGFNGKKTYLILLQNNMELRPGGGFIGSYGILVVKGGKIDSFKIYDIYDADGQLKGHVEPPFAIRRYFQSVNWYFRDSNFDVDFSKNAIAAAVFLNSEMHQSVDGVIGVDLSFVKNLISATGPVKVVDYSETVTADNLFKVVSSHTEKGFFPGSTQKKDFLSALYRSLQQELSTQKENNYLNLVQALSNSLFEKHIIFAFNNVSLQSVFSINGWGSTLFDNRSPDDSLANDFIGINEANIGANKVNYYVKRSISQEATLDEKGNIYQTLKISFRNLADKSLGKDGFYKSYLRIITPFNTKINNIKIDGVEQKIVNAITDPVFYESKKFIPPTGLEVDVQNESGKTIYGFLNSVDVGKLKTIEIGYSLSQKLNMTKNNFFYNLKVFKQPGIDSFPYVLALNFPDKLKPINLPAGVKINGNKILLSTDLTRDTQLIFNLVNR